MVAVLELSVVSHSHQLYSPTCHRILDVQVFIFFLITLRTSQPHQSCSGAFDRITQLSSTTVSRMNFDAQNLMIFLVKKIMFQIRQIYTYAIDRWKVNSISVAEQTN